MVNKHQGKELHLRALLDLYLDKKNLKTKTLLRYLPVSLMPLMLKCPVNTLLAD
jgi:hypothetical protein